MLISYFLKLFVKNQHIIHLSSHHVSVSKSSNNFKYFQGTTEHKQMNSLYTEPYVLIHIMKLIMKIIFNSSTDHPPASKNNLKIYLMKIIMKIIFNSSTDHPPAAKNKLKLNLNINKFMYALALGII